MQTCIHPHMKPTWNNNSGNLNLLVYFILHGTLVSYYRCSVHVKYPKKCTAPQIFHSIEDWNDSEWRTVKCMSESSVLPSSACWYWLASVSPSGNHYTTEKHMLNILLLITPCIFLGIINEKNYYFGMYLMNITLPEYLWYKSKSILLMRTAISYLWVLHWDSTWWNIWWFPSTDSTGMHPGQMGANAHQVRRKRTFMMKMGHFETYSIQWVI